MHFKITDEIHKKKEFKLISQKQTDNVTTKNDKRPKENPCTKYTKHRRKPKDRATIIIRLSSN